VYRQMSISAVTEMCSFGLREQCSVAHGVLKPDWMVSCSKNIRKVRRLNIPLL
jgi:hypothetical protein